MPAMLELAEGQQDPGPQFILVPDPRNQEDPIFVREDVFYNWPEPAINRMKAYLKSWNYPQKVDSFFNHVRSQSYSLRDDGSSSGDDYSEYVELINEVVSWFDSGSSTSPSGPPQQQGTFIGVNGMIYCVRNGIGFGLDPSGRRLIAFSSPAMVKTMFPNLPVGVGYVPLPAQVNVGLINYSLSHPDRIVRIVPGSNNTYEVAGPPIVLGNDANGNPIVINPGGTGGGAFDPKGSSGLLPLLGIGAAAMLLN